MAGYISIPPVDTLGLAVGRRCRFGREGACGYDPCLLCQRGWGRLGSLESGVGAGRAFAMSSVDRACSRSRSRNRRSRRCSRSCSRRVRYVPMVLFSDEEALPSGRSCGLDHLGDAGRFGQLVYARRRGVVNASIDISSVVDRGSGEHATSLHPGFPVPWLPGARSSEHLTLRLQTLTALHRQAPQSEAQRGNG